VDDKTRWYWQLKNIMVFHLPEAIRWIRLAKQELIDALPVADKLVNPPANRPALMKKINRHFAIDKMANRQMTLRMMIRVFEDMDVIRHAVQGGRVVDREKLRPAGIR
jgi:hypothetical protein